MGKAKATKPELVDVVASLVNKYSVRPLVVKYTFELSEEDLTAMVLVGKATKSKSECARELHKRGLTVSQIAKLLHAQYSHIHTAVSE